MDVPAESTAATFPAVSVIGDARLRAEAKRVAAAAEHQMHELELPLTRQNWTTARLLVLDTPSAASCAQAAYPRRPGVVIVTHGEPRLPDWQAATAVGAERVIALPGAAVELIASFTARQDPGVSGGVIVAVVGAAGGAGASVLSAAIAVRSAVLGFRGHTLLIDGAPLGGGLDLLLGMEHTPGLRWRDLYVAEGHIAAPALHAALPAARPGLAVLSYGRGAGEATPLSPGTIPAVLEAGRSAGDLVVCDISGERSPGAEHMMAAADLVVLIVPARLRAVAAAEAVAAYVERTNPLRGLVVRGPAPGGLRPQEIAKLLNIPLVATIRAQPQRIAQLEGRGFTLGRGPLRKAADAVLAALPVLAGREVSR